MYEFGNYKDLILKKKVEHFCKSIQSEKKLEKYCTINKRLKEEYDKRHMRLKELIFEIRKSQITLKEKEKEERRVAKEERIWFIKKFILPSLIEKNFFDNYHLPPTELRPLEYREKGGKEF